MAQDLDIGMKCVKYMLFVANVMFVMVAFLLISIGSTVGSIYADFEHFMQSYYFSPASLTVAIGCIMLFVSLFGCIGAIKESTCLVNTYAAFLTIILILEIGATIAAYAMRSNIEDEIREEMTFTFNRTEIGENEKAWDLTQQYLGCCGVDGPSDYSVDASKGNELPDSCYIRNDGKGKFYQSGCMNKLAYIVSECALLLGCGELCVAFIQLLGIIFAHLLAKSIRSLKTQRLVDRERNRQQLYEQLAKGNEEKVSPVIYTPSYSEA